MLKLHKQRFHKSCDTNCRRMYDMSLAALGVPRSKFSSIHARCSRAALDMHEFMLQCYYQIRGQGVCERHHAHITIERLPRQLLPRCLQCHLEYGRRRINTCPVFPQSPPIRIGPRTSTGSVAAGWHGLALFAAAPFGFQ